MQSSLRIYIFLESIYRSEDFHHAIEHRLFEDERIKALENIEHSILTAYAYNTGILFKIISTHHSEQDILNTYNSVFADIIPNFSPKEQKRFIQEENELRYKNATNLAHISGYQFTHELELPVPQKVRLFSDFIARKSIVVRKGEIVTYSEQRYSPTTYILLSSCYSVTARGKEFHLIAFHVINSLTDSLYEAIYSKYIEFHIKNICYTNGEIYDVWLSTYYEAGYTYTGFYWYLDTNEKFSFSDRDVIFDKQSFDQFKKSVYLDGLLGYEEYLHGHNVIVGNDPVDEIQSIDGLSYEGFIQFKEKNKSVLRLYSSG